MSKNSKLYKEKRESDEYDFMQSVIEKGKHETLNAFDPDSWRNIPDDGPVNTIDTNSIKGSVFDPDIFTNISHSSYPTGAVNTETYEEIGKRIGKLVSEKNLAYGDSFEKSRIILQTLYPNGVTTDKYKDFLAIVRVIDKLFRIATDKDAFGESPWNDICGYSILAINGKGK